MGFELLFPVVLFILTLIIIFLLLSDEKRNQRADIIRERSQALLKTVEGSLTQFNESAQIVEERISKKIDESRLLMSHVDSQLTDLEARSEDLATLQKVLTTYQTTLTELESTTAQVEQRVLVMRGEVANLGRVQESFSDFDLRFEQFKQNLGKQIVEGEESMHLQHLRVKELQSAALAKLQEYEKEVQQAEQDNLAQIAIHTETFKNRQEASLTLVSVQATKLRQLSEDGEQQMLQYEKALQTSYRQFNEKMQEQQREFAQLQVIHAEQQKSQKEELLAIEENAIRRITEELVQQCYSEMGKIFEMTLKKTDISFQNMIRVVSEYLKELSLRLEQARDATKLLGASERESLPSFKEELDALLHETLKGEPNLETLQGLEEKAFYALVLLHQEADQLQASLATLKTEKNQASPEEEPSVMDEPLEEQGENTESVVEEKLQDTPGEEDENTKVELKQKPETEMEKQDGSSESEQHVASKNRQVEYLAESEEEVIILDQDNEPSR